MKKYLMTLAAVLCCAMTTTMFTACGDDVKVYDSYSYFIEFNEFSAVQYDSYEAALILNDLKKTVGYDKTMYRSFEDNMDEQFKTACANVISTYTNLSSVYMSFTLYRSGTANSAQQEIATFVAGKCLTTPYAKLGLTAELDKTRLKVIGDSLLKLKTAEDSVKWKTFLHATNNTAWAIQVDLKKGLGDYLEKTLFWPEKNFERYTDAFLDSLVISHLHDTLLVDFNIGISKTQLPSNKSSWMWARKFKATVKDL